ncbi:Ras-related protein RABF2b [Chionoecetes opilio]|uniref:Ras-related protein RABF2b n=1 Tax=Chionoecetes opilio TaxID=41210 RepID=A0A8J8WAC3_CHIOP|nr:Ras-related protein RABF2b [Chionoecetes opilio]
MKTVAVKVVILGSQGVGKTSLVTRYETESFNRSTSSTIGASFSNVEVVIDDTKVKMQVWDTAGQERFRSMAPMYYRGANAALLVFDLTCYDTFTDVKSWAHELMSHVDGELMMVVVGNKTDLLEERVVGAAAATDYTASIGAYFFETSALDNTGVKEMFYAVAARMVQQSKSKKTNSALRVYSPDGKNDKQDDGASLRVIEVGEAQERGGSCSC